MVWTICFWRERLLDLGTFFLRAAVLWSVPVFFPADFFLRVVFFLAMRRSLSLGPVIAPRVGLLPVAEAMVRAVERTGYMSASSREVGTKKSKPKSARRRTLRSESVRDQPNS